MGMTSLLGSAKAKADHMMTNFNDALPILRDLGLSVSKVVVGMGFLPTMNATLRGLIESVNKARIQQLITQHEDNKIAVTVLKALHTAANVQDVVKGIPFKGIQVHMKLGLGFKVEVEFLRDAVPGPAPQRSQVQEKESARDGHALPEPSMEALEAV